MRTLAAWSSATLEFSNGQKVSIALKNTAAAQEFVFLSQLTAWVKRSDQRETFPLSDNGVTEWELYGKDVGEQGASIARTLSRN